MILFYVHFNVLRVCCCWMDYAFLFFSYEGTIWDDYAHGKGVYVSDDGLVRFVFAPLRCFI